MIRVTQIKLPINHDKDALLQKTAKTVKIPINKIQKLNIIKQSIDARKKPNIFYSYTVDITLVPSWIKKESSLVNNKNIMLSNQAVYEFPKIQSSEKKSSPVIVGSGPAGLFCAWMLAKADLAPVILERGEAVEDRCRSVEDFWKTGILNTESNVQFGEGGAGTFSDGKLNTSVKDPKGRNFQVLKMFVDAGAPREILYQQKPHLGTDQLIHIVKNLRQQIEKMGGRFYFNSCMTDLSMDDRGICGVEINHQKWIDTRTLVLALGHSARDTFHMLYEKGISMEAKAFAAGVRIQHPQALINLSQYGKESVEKLGAAPYKLTFRSKNDRGIYSFCMCPGGYVVNASSEAAQLAINGMSYSGRDSENANSALIVTVTPEDFNSYALEDTPDALKGIDFQRYLETKAFNAADGAIPLQLYGDFIGGKKSSAAGGVTPCVKGSYAFSDLNEILPEFMTGSLREAIENFGSKIKGFDRYDCLLAGVESRSSSPLRIIRDETMQSNIGGIYPCGEGAGYAGGITSAAIDGLKTAERIAASMFL